MPNLVGKGLEIPDVGYRNAERNMSHALSTDGLLRHLDAASVTDNAFVANPLVFTTMAFPIFHGPKDLLAEETIFFWLERTVIDGLGLENLPVRTFQDALR